MKTVLNTLIRFTKGITIISVAFALLLGAIIIFDSCKKNDIVIVDEAVNRFINNYNLNLDKYISTNITTPDNTNTRSTAVTSENNTSVYLLFPEDTQPEIKELTEEVVTIQDLSDLIRLTDATMQYHPNEHNINYKIEISEDKIVNEMEPFIKNAKEYLYRRGFSEEEIIEMIKENDANETDLVPFVLKLSEAELSDAVYAYKHQMQTLNLLDIFASPTYAKDLELMDYLDCALVAVGADVFYSLSWSGAKTWTKAAMKRAFSAVVKRALGPIGAAITVASFGICMYNKYTSNITCTYAIPAPSHIQIAYENIVTTYPALP